MMKKRYFFALIAILATGLSLWASETVSSPSGNISVEFGLTNTVPTYQVFFNGKEVIAKSTLGLDLVNDEASLRSGFTLTHTDRTSFDETWQPVWGEETSIRNHYNEMAVTLTQTAQGRLMVVRFRVYDDGVGFRYEFPQQKNLNYFVIAEERTQFAMTGDHTAWWIAGDYDTQEYEG